MSIKISNTEILDQKIDIANALGRNYQNISNGKNSSNSFQKYREGRERHIDFSSSFIEEYNVSIKLKELKNAIKTSRDTAPGEDGIPYIMIKQLSEDSLNYLLKFYNLVFKNHLFPETWKEAIVIPILKPGKDATKCSSYRPIALITCLSKIMEKIINKRLMWYLEKKKIINKSQCGFRKGRNTTDHLTRLTSDILEALVNNEYHISIFLDLEKAYDTVWKQVILNQLEKHKIKGHLAFYIQNFLQQRTIKVKVGNSYSEKLILDLGVPQGSSISVTLFLIAINTILDFIPNERLQTSLFVDDCRLSLRVKSLDKDTKKDLQTILNNVQNWASQTGFKFAEGKTEMMICTRKPRHKDPPQLELTLDGKKVKIVTEKKFLGVWFDWKMLWHPQIRYVKDKCIRPLRLLKTLAISKTKTDTKMLLRIYKTMVLPKLEYGCLAYETAANTTLEKLDPTHHHGLRLCLGAFHTTPKESLYVESNIHSLSYRRKILGIKYYARTLTIDRNDTITNLQDKRRDYMFQNSKRFETTGIKIKNDMAELKIKFPPILQHSVSRTPPWIIPEANVCFEMEKFSKKITPTREIISEFLKHKHKTDIDIYTDGSKTDKGVGAGIAIKTKSNTTNWAFKKANIPQSNKATILSAELKAISIGLKVIEKSSNTTCTVYSDSKGALQAIMQYDPINPLLQEIQAKINRAFAYNNKIILIPIINTYLGIEIDKN